MVGWWPSHPAESVNGAMVSDHYHTAIGVEEQPWPVPPGAVHPPELAAALADLRVHPNVNVEQVGFFVPNAAGEARLRLRRWDEAEQAYRQVLGIARSLLPRLQAEAAAEAALECIQLHYHYPLARYVLGLARVRLRKFERAGKALTTAVALNPNFAQAHRVLVRLYTYWLPGQPLNRQEHLELLRQIRSNKGVAEANGRAVKVVAQLLPMLPADQHYRVLFIERDPTEVLRSQKVMLERLGRPAPKLSDERLEQTYA